MESFIEMIPDSVPWNNDENVLHRFVSPFRAQPLLVPVHRIPNPLSSQGIYYAPLAATDWMQHGIGWIAAESCLCIEHSQMKHFTNVRMDRMGS